MLDATIREKLGPDDDPTLWAAVLSLLTDEVVYRRGLSPKPKQDWLLQVGACSHWVRPHQSRWTAAGGFAWPSGYGGVGGRSLDGLPEFDWSFTFRLFNRDWVPVEHFAGRSQAVLRVAVPSRTARHKQAAVHTVWTPGHRTVFYGFRLSDAGWRCVAASDEETQGRISV